MCCRHHGITAPDVVGLALQCSERRTLKHWGHYDTTGPAGGHRPGTPRGCTPRGQAEGDIYPKHFSVDQDKIFILLSHCCTRTAAPLSCRSFVPTISTKYNWHSAESFLRIHSLRHCMYKHKKNILIRYSAALMQVVLVKIQILPVMKPPLWLR